MKRVMHIPALQHHCNMQYSHSHPQLMRKIAATRVEFVSVTAATQILVHPVVIVHSLVHHMVHPMIAGYTEILDHSQVYMRRLKQSSQEMNYFFLGSISL